MHDTLSDRGDELHDPFCPRQLTFGVEQEVMLLDLETLDLDPRAEELLPEAERSVDGIKLELPASQLEVVTRPRETIPDLVEDLAAGRRRLSELVGDRARLASTGTHPFASPEGQLNTGPYHIRMEREYGSIARRQLVCAQHIHVGLSDGERVLAVYNTLRAYLPELAALAANGPLCRGRESGFASMRPLLSGLLPRQGVPPVYRSWEELADDLEWGTHAGRLAGSSGWWWELRIHPILGTIEIRVPDAQTTVADAGALIAVTVGLVLLLAELHDADGLPDPVPAWRIAENRWSAARHGIHGEMFDLTTGVATPTRDRLHHLIGSVTPLAESVGGGQQIEHAHALAERNGADRQLEVAHLAGAAGLAEWLTSQFLEGCDDSGRERVGIRPRGALNTPPTVPNSDSTAPLAQ